MGRMFAGLILALLSAPLQAEEAPFRLAEGLFDQSKPETLGLERAPGTETFTVYRPGEGQNAYNHGVVLMPFKGRLYVMWQSSREDEDAPDTLAVFSSSADLETWTAPKALAPRQDGHYFTSGGWLVAGDELLAFVNVWPSAEDAPRGGRTQFVSSRDGVHWSEPMSVLDDEGRAIAGVIEQDMRALPDGRIIGAFHMQPGLVATPHYTDDPRGVSGWTKGRMANLPSEGEVSRELEPSWFLRKDGAIVMIFRDQASSYKTLASVNMDRGATWTRPELVEFPDSRSKQSAGNLPNQAAYRVSNPVPNKARFPLVLTLSKDGFVFDRAYLLRAGGRDMQPLRYEGRYKRPSYSYPKSIVWGDHLYAAYATNKEDVEFTRVPWRGLSD